MALETANYIGNLVATNPAATDPKAQGDDHLRMIKSVLLNSFAGFTGGVACTGTDGGAVNAYTVTPANTLPGYVARLSVVFSPVATNTSTAPTINVSGLGAVPIKRVDGAALLAGELVSGSIYVVIYNGSEFRLISPTKQYIDQLAFGSALPAQNGNAGRYLTTDGSSASWGQIITDGLGGTSITGDVVLNALSPSDMVVAADVNLLTYSEQFNNAVWTKTGTATVAQNTAVAPDGNTTADTISIPSASVIYQAIAAAPGNTYTMSIWLRASVAITVTLVSNTNLSDPVSLPLSVTTDWQRFSLTRSVSVGTTTVNLQLNPISVASTVYAWGAQINAGNLLPYSKTDSVTGGSYGRYATLPNASTLTKGMSKYAIYNGSSYSYGVKDNSGNTLGWILPNTGATIGLADNSTASGIWSYVGLSKIGVTNYFSSLSLSNTQGGGIRQVITLDNTRKLYISDNYAGGYFYGIVYDKDLNIFGSPTLLTSALAGGVSGILSGTDQVLLCSCNGGAVIYTRTLTILGLSITVNTAVSTTLSANVVGFSIPIKVGSSFIFGGNHTGLSQSAFVIAVTVSGIVPTIGAEFTTSTSSPAPQLYSAASIVRVVCRGNSTIQIIPLTVSGTSLSIGTIATINVSQYNFRSFINTNGNIVLMYQNSTDQIGISRLVGTTETVTSVSTGTVTLSSTISDKDYVNLPNGKIAVVHRQSSTVTFDVITDMNGVPSKGTSLTWTENNYVSLQGLGASGNLARFGISSAYNTGSAIEQFILDCSGTSPTFNYFHFYLGESPPIFAASDSYGAWNNLFVNGTNLRLISPFSSSRLDISLTGISSAQSFQPIGSTYSISATEMLVSPNLINNQTAWVIQRIESAA